MQPDLWSVNFDYPLQRSFHNSSPLVYLCSTVKNKLHSYPLHLFNVSQHSQGFRVKVVLDDNRCCCLTKQYNKGWGNKRRRGCVSLVVCLTILSHALIAQSPLLASAGAQWLSHVVRAPWLHCAGKNRFYWGDSPSVGSQACVMFHTGD